MWAPLAFAALLVGAVVVGVPSSGQFGFAETLVQAVLLGGYAVGWLLALRWTMAGATLMAVTGVGVAALSALQYQPDRGALLAVVLFVPAGLLWWTWRRGRGLVPVVALALATVTVFAMGAVAADEVYDVAYGPQAPQSTVGTRPADRVGWIWSGALTPTSARVVAQLRADLDDLGGSEAVVLRVEGAGATTSVRAKPSTEDVVGFDLTALVPGTTYEYVVEVGGRPDASRGRGSLTTPLEGPQSFTVAFGSCARLGSDALTFQAVAGTDPLLFLVTGDFFYADIARNDLSDFARAYDRQLTAPAIAALTAQVPVAYMWDDHDFGPNDADRTSPSKAASLQAYRSFVPHYPLVLDDGDGPISQAFTIGRVRFLLPDLRSQRDPAGDPDGEGKTLLGAVQRAWLEQELVTASQQNALVVWVSSVPWIVPAGESIDTWGGYATERAALAEVVAAHDIDNLVVLAGDAHMTAADDGTHSDYSAEGGAGFPVLHAGPLDQRTSVKGGPYSEGVSAEPGQYGLLTVTDAGGAEVTVAFDGRTADGRTVVDYAWTVPVTSPAAG